MDNNGEHAHIWAYVLAITQPIGLKCFMGVKETIIYRLVMRSLSYDAHLSVFIFWRENGRGHHSRP